VHAETFSRAAAEERAVHRPRPAPVDALALLVPEEHALRAGIALDHALGVVVGVVGQHFDGDEIAGVHLDEGGRSLLK
jgi:hypothetical protein